MQRARAGTGKAEEASPLHSTCPGTSGFWLTPETGPGCRELGTGQPFGGLCHLAGRWLTRGAASGGASGILGAPSLSAQQALPWNLALAKDPEPCPCLLQRQRAVGRPVWDEVGPGTVCLANLQARGLQGLISKASHPGILLSSPLPVIPGKQPIVWKTRS